MKEIPQFCQNCRAVNRLGERTCRVCGTKLMLVVFPSAIRYDESAVPSFYEDHLLERVTLLENRLAQIAERLSSTLDLLLRQSKFAQSDHLLLETLIDSLNALGAIEKENLTRNWQKTVSAEEKREVAGHKNRQIVEKIISSHKKPNGELFSRLINEGIRLLSEKEEKQALRNFEKALLLSPENVALAVFIAERHFQADEAEAAKIYLEKALALAPRSEKVLLLLSVLSADEKEFAKSRALLERLSKKRRFKPVVNFICGILSAAEGDWTRAQAAFKEFAFVSALPEANYLLGCADFEAGLEKTAVRHLQKAVETDPNYADAWFMLALCYEKNGDDAKREKAMELARAATEPAAQSRDFLNPRRKQTPDKALPFLRLQQSDRRLLSALPVRLQKLLREEILKAINE